LEITPPPPWSLHADAFDMLGVGVTKGYDLINIGRIDTVLIGRRRYATRESLERLATQGLASAVTPTKAKHGRWSGRNPSAGLPEDVAE
jgi:hypothetical protein